MKKKTSTKSIKSIVKRKPRAKAKTVTPAKVDQSLIIDKLPGYFLILCMLISLGLLFYIIWPFITAILLGAVFVIVFYPLFRWLSRVFRGWNRLAAFISCLFVILVIVAPLAAFGGLLVEESVDIYDVAQEKFFNGDFDSVLKWEDGGILYDVKEWFKEQLSPFVEWESVDLSERLVGLAGGVSSFLIEQSGAIVEGFFMFVLSLIIMVFSMYYFFKDGKEIVDWLGRVSPLPIVYENELFEKVILMVKAIVYGVFLAAILQGLIGAIGFMIAGISNVVFWGAAMAFFSIVPVVGTAIVWGPAVLILFFTGNYWEAIFLALWGVFMVGSIDNFLRSYLIGGKARTHPLITFVVVVGSIIVLNLKGVVIGPLILMIVMSFLHIFEVEYSKVLKK